MLEKDSRIAALNKKVKSDASTINLNINKPFS